LPLRGVRVIDARAVLRADVVALPIALGRIVVLPEDLQQILIADLFGIKDDEDDFSVIGGAAADLAIRGVLRLAGGVADRGGVDARLLPELLFRAPEAAHAEHRGLGSGGKRRDDRMLADEVRVHGLSFSGSNASDTPFMQ